MNKFLIGFSTGLLLGLLLAPARGSETRQTISNRGRDIKNKFNDLVDSVVSKFDSMKNEVTDKAMETREAARSAFKNEMI